MFSQLEKAIFFYSVGYFYRRRENKAKKLRTSILAFGLIVAYLFGTLIRSQDASLYSDGVTGSPFTIGELFITAFIAPICACLWFALFERNSIDESRKINQIASTTFGVYLIHESIVGRPLFWYNILRVDTLQYQSVLFPISALISVIFVFAVCASIDICREKYVQPLQLRLFNKLR